MNDLTNWNLHGPVRFLWEETTQQDPQTATWLEPQQRPTVTFRSDGKVELIEGRNPDGAVYQTRFTYDALGNLVETQFRLGDGPATITSQEYDEQGRQTRTTLRAAGGAETLIEMFRYSDDGARSSTRYLDYNAVTPTFFGIEGTDSIYVAEGAATMTTLADQQGRVSEVTFHDRDHVVVRRVVFTRDPKGRLLREVSDSIVPTSLMREFENAPADVRATLAETMAQMFTFTTEYLYDANGKVQQKIQHTGLSEDRETMRYDEFGNILDQTTEHHSREVSVETQEDSRIGTTPVSESSHIHYSRFDYEYDERGNWTKRTSSYRLGPNPDFQESGIDRRQIEYFQ